MLEIKVEGAELNACPYRLRHSHFDCAWLSWLFSPPAGRRSGAVAANAD
jgi:hypothetical protein